MLGVVDELRQRIVDGEVFSLAVLAEISGQSEAVAVVHGRFDSDPYRALLALKRLSRKLHRQLDGIEHPSNFSDAA